MKKERAYKMAVNFNGTFYPSLSALARANGIPPTTLRSRLKRNIPLQIAVNTLGRVRAKDSKYVDYVANGLIKPAFVEAALSEPEATKPVESKPAVKQEPLVFTKADATNPTYYHKGKYECIDILEEVLKDTSGIKAFCLGNCIKYLWRHAHKNGVEDLRKAKWYLEKLISNIDTEISEIVDKDTDL